jgi:hypothetical protein
VAFGPSGDDYALLQRMAETLPRSKFQKLGLNVANLRTAFSSLTDSLSSLRSSIQGVQLTQRSVKKAEVFTERHFCCAVLRPTVLIQPTTPHPLLLEFKFDSM